MQLQMNKRNALVTGGSYGIGRAIANRFAGAGANVAIIARGKDALETAKAEIAAACDTKVVAIASETLPLRSFSTLRTPTGDTRPGNR